MALKAVEINQQAAPPPVSPQPSFQVVVASPVPQRLQSQPVEVWHGESYLTSANQPYTRTFSRPPAIKYCWQDVPASHRPYISAGIESWSGAYPIQETASEDCNLLVGLIPANSFHGGAGSSWGEAWGNLCGVFIHPMIINVSQEVPIEELPAVTAHEMGHILCLGHSDDPANVMHLQNYSMPTEFDIDRARRAIGQ